MFQALANYAVRGPLQAALVASSTLILSVVLAPLVVISSAVIALVWMRLGPRSAAIAIAISLAFTTVIALLTALPVMAPAGFMVSSWLPVLVMAWVLRDTVSLNLALLAGAGLIALILAVVYLAIPDPAAYWRELFDNIMDSGRLRPQQFEGLQEEEVNKLMDAASRYATGLYAGIWFALSAVGLLLARAWQARLYNPGGLQKEFHELRFGHVSGLVGVGLILAALLTRSEFLYGLAAIACVLFTLQGLAVLHAIVARREMHRGWLVALYVLFMFVPLSLLVVMALGLSDTWLEYRNKFAKQVP